MIKILTILCSLIIVSGLKAQEASLRLNFYDFDNDVTYFVFGVGINAVDTFGIEDQEQPPFPPPGGMMPLATLKSGVDNDGDQMYTQVNVDIRYAPSSTTVTKTYRFDVLGSFTSTPWRIQWGIPPKELKSATLTDLLNQYEVDLLAVNSLEVDKPISMWQIEAEWNLDLTSVEDIDGQKSPFQEIDGRLIYSQQHSIMIYDLNGRTVYSGNNTYIDTELFNKGTYIIVSESNNKRYLDKIIVD